MDEKELKVKQDFDEIISSAEEVMPIQPFDIGQCIETLKQLPKGKELGYPSLDKHVGLRPGELTIIAGRVGYGKTAFLLNLFYNQFTKYPDVPFIYLAYECSKEQLFTRIMARHGATKTGQNKYKYSGREYYSYLSNEVTEDMQSNIRAIRDNADWITAELSHHENFYIEDKPYFVEEYDDILESIRIKHKQIGGIFIDYLQIIPTKAPEVRNQIRQVQLGHICKKLVDYGKEYQVPIIAGAQIRRKTGDKAQDPYPTLERLREAGDIEQSASIVLGLWNEARAKTIDDESVPFIDEISTQPNPSTDLRVIILKNRFGVSHLCKNMTFNMEQDYIKE